MLSDSVRVFIGDCIDGSLSVDKMRSPVPRPNASDKPGIALGLRPREELVIIRRQKSAFAKCERGGSVLTQCCPVAMISTCQRLKKQRQRRLTRQVAVIP